MYNDIFSIGGFTIHGYGLCIAIGLLLAVMLSWRRAQKLNLSQDAVVDLGLLLLVCGLAGAKLLYVIVYFRNFVSDPLSVLGGEGFVVYGGIVFGFIALLTYCRIKKLKLLAYLDLIVPSVALAQGFGRIGCLLAGCCYGKKTTLPIGIIFPKGSLAPAGVSLLPTQIFSSIGDFLLAALLFFLAKKERQNGIISASYFALYGIGRFLMEFLRGDYRGALGLLSTSQIISVLSIVLAAVLFWFSNKNNTPETEEIQ